MMLLLVVVIRADNIRIGKQRMQAGREARRKSQLCREWLEARKTGAGEMIDDVM